VDSLILAPLVFLLTLINETAIENLTVPLVLSSFLLGMERHAIRQEMHFFVHAHSFDTFC
jgi:hypothetical protein